MSRSTGDHEEIERTDRYRMKRHADEERDDLAERISLACYHQFDSLPSRGKPSSHEWTHLAAFVAVEKSTATKIDVLSMGTGTKCLGETKEERGTQGCLLHDSHAEVIARRALLRFFYQEMIDRQKFVFIEKDNNQFDWNPTLDLYLFVSYPPCGAAASLSDPVKRPRLEHKTLSSSGNQLYLKPGKGSPTSSLSCTNKINRWIHQGQSLDLDHFVPDSDLFAVGLEGTLLNQLIKSPIRLSGLIVRTDADLSSVFNRIPVVQSVSSPFTYSPSTQRIRPCAMSLAWWLRLDLCSSVITVDGHPLGQIRRLRHQQTYANPLAKASLFRLYLQLVKSLPRETTTYAHAKSLSSNSLRDEYLSGHPQWPITDPDVFYAFALK